MFFETLSTANWLAILVASLAYFALGAIWYSALFSKQWVALNNVDVNAPDAKKGMVQTFVTSILMNIVTSTALYVLMRGMEIHGLMNGIKMGLLCGFAFSTMTMAMGLMYLKKPFMLYVIECGYQLAGIVLAGAIIGAWR